MRVESFVTCHDVRDQGQAGFNLDGVFRKLAGAPTEFLVFIELRGLEASIRVRCRVPGMRGDSGTWFESWDELTLPSGSMRDAHTVVMPILDVEPPGGRSVIEVLIDGRVGASRLVEFE